MKLNINSNVSGILAVFVWIILGSYFYSPVTSFVTSRILERFRPVASIGTLYSLSSIDKTQFATQPNAYAQVGLTHEYGFGSSIGSQDGRTVALKRFLRDQKSPLEPYADVLVSQADAHGLDWRLVAAISGIESRFCRITPADTNNCWGWRGGPGGDWSKFASYKEGIETLTNGLAYGYGTKLTPYQIEPAYCPPCAESGHKWALAVTIFMGDISSYLENSRVSQ